jgi:hypothetical protein
VEGELGAAAHAALELTQQRIAMHRQVPHPDAGGVVDRTLHCTTDDVLRLAEKRAVFDPGPSSIVDGPRPNV